MNADELFNIEGVPCYVVFTADGPIEGGDPDAYFQRRSSGIIADIHDALEEGKENLVAHNTSSNVIELEIVDKEPEADKEAEELPLLERTMNEEVEAEAGGLSGIAKQMAQLSMFGNEPKRVRRSQMEFQAMVKEKEAKEEKKTEDRGNTYNLRPRSSSNTRAGSSSQQQSQISFAGRRLLLLSLVGPRLQRHLSEAGHHLQPHSAAPHRRPPVQSSLWSGSACQGHLPLLPGPREAVKLSSSANRALFCQNVLPISSWVERLSQPKLTPAVIAARERRRTADVAGPSRPKWQVFS
ncbi:unnamed protein product, partial [Mesorhabditis spiculigera]